MWAHNWAHSDVPLYKHHCLIEVIGCETPVICEIIIFDVWSNVERLSRVNI